MNPDHSRRNILITGASGFIGSFLVEAALKQRFNVYAGVRRSSKLQYLTDPRIQILPLDLAFPGLLEQQLRAFHQTNRTFDIVIHNAGVTRVRQLREFDTVNHLYTRNLVEALRTTGSLPNKFVYMSSLATYGPGDPYSGEPIQLTTLQRPVSAYARSKLAAEQYLLSLSSPDILIIRPTAVYGPRDRDFFSYFRLLKWGIDIEIGRDRQWLSFVYVKDLANAVIDVSQLATPQPAYLISDERVYDKAELGQAFRRILGIKAWKIKLSLAAARFGVYASEGMFSLFNRTPFIHTEKLKEITAGNWLCNSSSIWNDLGREPGYDLEKGVAETVHWYKEQGWW